MNRFLASAIGTINAIVAWALLFIPPIAGGVSYGAEGFLAGLVLGVVLAIVLCGMLALLIDIRNSLRKIAHSVAAKPSDA